MIRKLKAVLKVSSFALARKLGYVPAGTVAMAFADGWYMHRLRKEAMWQSIEEAFANSEVQFLTPRLQFKQGALTDAYFDYLTELEQVGLTKATSTSSKEPQGDKN